MNSRGQFDYATEQRLRAEAQEQVTSEYDDPTPFEGFEEDEDFGEGEFEAGDEEQDGSPFPALKENGSSEPAISSEPSEADQIEGIRDQLQAQLKVAEKATELARASGDIREQAEMIQKGTELRNQLDMMAMAPETALSDEAIARAVTETEKAIRLGSKKLHTTAWTHWDGPDKKELADELLRLQIKKTALGIEQESRQALAIAKAKQEQHAKDAQALAKQQEHEERLQAEADAARDTAFEEELARTPSWRQEAVYLKYQKKSPRQLLEEEPPKDQDTLLIHPPLKVLLTRALTSRELTY